MIVAFRQIVNYFECDAPPTSFIASETLATTEWWIVELTSDTVHGPLSDDTYRKLVNKEPEKFKNLDIVKTSENRILPPSALKDCDNPRLVQR